MKIWYLCVTLFSLNLIASAVDSGKYYASRTTGKHRHWSIANDQILLEILINLLNDEDWKEIDSFYVQDILRDIQRLAKSPAIKPYKDIIMQIEKESILSRTTMCSTPSSG